MLMLVLILYSLVVSAQDREPVDRELPLNMSTTVKGNVFVSTTFSVKHSESENETRLLQNLDDSYRLNWNVTLRSGYFIKDNFAVGGYFKYANKLDQLTYTNDAGEVFDESLERSYSIAPFIRNYLPLGKGSFALFNETNLEFTYGSDVRQVEDANDINRTSGNSYMLKLGIQPGIAAFINELVSVEVGTSVLGLSSKYSTTRVNDDKDNEGYTWNNEVSFEIDLLSLFLGITFYFPAK